MYHKKQSLGFNINFFTINFAIGNGYIDYEELRTVLKFCTSESTLHFSDENLNELTRVLFEDADEDNSGTITFEELKAQLEKHPGVIENLTIGATSWLRPPQFHQRRNFSHYIPHWMSRKYVKNNLAWVVWLCLYFIINVILFTEAIARHSSGVSYSL